MIIDCDSCTVRGEACRDCAVTALLGQPPEGELDDTERQALVVLAEGGLLPPLRLVPPSPTIDTFGNHSCAERRRSAG